MPTLGEIVANTISRTLEIPFDVRMPEIEDDGEMVGAFRKLKVCDAPPPLPVAASIEAAREQLWAALNAYRADPGAATYMLLARSAPGVGKTTLAVRMAESLALAGKRVLYAGPRHDFFQDLMEIAEHPELWYEWLPRRQGGDGEDTCHYCKQMSAWLHRGYRAIDFCSRICGWEYVGECPYHRQKARKEPIIFGQHQHVTLGHPLNFDWLIGDESPLGSFTLPWAIPSKFVVPKSLPFASPAHILCEELYKLTRGDPLEGGKLLDALGGAQNVQDALAEVVLPADPKVLCPDIHTAEEAEEAPYAHVIPLLRLLQRESKLALMGQEYPHRLIAGDFNLWLMLRREVNDEMPSRVIWLDATGNERLYEACFKRPVKTVFSWPKVRGKVVCVYDRQNGKRAVTKKETKAKMQEQIVAQVERVEAVGHYKNLAVIAAKEFVENVPELNARPHAHFYGARGTNKLQDADAIVIIGSPQPPIPALEAEARMLFFERDEAFRYIWSARDVPFQYRDEDGMGRAYPTSGFWGDPDLEAILWSYREAELVQAAYRCRPVNHASDIYLLTNTPLADLPADQLISIRELMDAPVGINVFEWSKVLDMAQRIAAIQNYVSGRDLMDTLGISRPTATHYLDLLTETGDWEMAVVRQKGSTPGPQQRRAAIPRKKSVNGG